MLATLERARLRVSDPWPCDSQRSDYPRAESHASLSSVLGNVSPHADNELLSVELQAARLGVTRSIDHDGPTPAPVVQTRT